MKRNQLRKFEQRKYFFIIMLFSRSPFRQTRENSRRNGSTSFSSFDPGSLLNGLRSYRCRISALKPYIRPGDLNTFLKWKPCKKSLQFYLFLSKFLPAHAGLASYNHTYVILLYYMKYYKYLINNAQEISLSWLN